MKLLHFCSAGPVIFFRAKPAAFLGSTDSSLKPINEEAFLMMYSAASSERCGTEPKLLGLKNLSTSYKYLVLSVTPVSEIASRIERKMPGSIILAALPIF